MWHRVKIWRDYLFFFLTGLEDGGILLSELLLFITQWINPIRRSCQLYKMFWFIDEAKWKLQHNSSIQLHTEVCYQTTDLFYQLAISLFQCIHFGLQVSDCAAEVSVQFLNVVLLVQNGRQFIITDNRNGRIKRMKRDEKGSEWNRERFLISLALHELSLALTLLVCHCSGDPSGTERNQWHQPKLFTVRISQLSREQ